MNNAEQLVDAGNRLREENQPLQALAHYAQAFIVDPDNFSAWNNYGNVLRECGRPDRAIPFLETALKIVPGQPTANFNLAVAYLLSGDYNQGWKQYETRWSFEHLNGMLPTFEQPRWSGEDLRGKTILVVGEQGHGDNIQFLRFIEPLVDLGAEVILQVSDTLIPLFSSSLIKQIIGFNHVPAGFDYWTPIMSIPGVLKTTLDQIPNALQYIVADTKLIQDWQKRLGLKKKLRVGFCWSGRRDTWINRHKGMPFFEMLTLIKQNPDYEWVNLQADCSADEEQILISAGVKTYPGIIKDFGDTAALIHHLDVVLSVDTAVAHLSGAMGRPTWIMLNSYALDWRWLLNRDDSPWYQSARLFRQPTIGDWASVTKKIHQYLSWYKV
jgi:hypothetical protein